MNTFTPMHRKTACSQKHPLQSKTLSKSNKSTQKMNILLKASFIICFLAFFFIPRAFSQIAPAISFNENPVNHNMHITSDGAFFYSINGGNAGTGQVNKFTLGGVLVQTYPIQIDGRGMSWNPVDGLL